jgi:Skp family chaperone for outer membrane proteins
MYTRFFAILLLSTLVSGPALASQKIGVVDVRAIMDAVPAWGKVVTKMKKTWDRKQKKLENRQAELKAKKIKLDQKRIVSDPQTIAKEEAQLMQNAQILGQQFMQEQRLITAQELDLKEQMLKRIEPLVYALAAKLDLAFVFERGSDEQPNVLYFSKKVSLTKKVVQAYMAKYKGKAFEVRQPKMPGPAGASR